MLYKSSLRLPFVLGGTGLEVPSSVPLGNGGGVTGRVLAGATQPNVEAVQGLPASCRNTSLLTGSAGRDSKGRAKRATCSPRHRVRGAGAVEDSK